MNKTAVAKVQQNAIAVLDKLKNVYEEAKELHSADNEANVNFEKDIEHIAKEKEKVQEMEFSIGMIGTMKAGKSTVLNAIVGHDIAPSRSEAMTVLPCIISHNP